MINTKNFTMTQQDGTEYQISADYEENGDIVAIVIKGDCSDLLSWANYNNVVDAFNEVMKNDDME